MIHDSQHQGSHCALLQSLLDDFVQHNVDTACGLLETAGRFLYRLPETHTRMANMAEVCTLLGHLVAFAGSKADNYTRHCRCAQTLLAATGKNWGLFRTCSNVVYAVCLSASCKESMGSKQAHAAVVLCMDK